MKVLEFEDRKIYRPKKGYKVKFQDNDKTFSEICVALDNKRIIEEVKK